MRGEAQCVVSPVKFSGRVRGGRQSPGEAEEVPLS